MGHLKSFLSQKAAKLRGSTEGSIRIILVVIVRESKKFPKSYPPWALVFKFWFWSNLDKSGAINFQKWNEIMAKESGVLVVIRYIVYGLCLVKVFSFATSLVVGAWYRIRPHREEIVAIIPNGTLTNCANYLIAIAIFGAMITFLLLLGTLNNNKLILGTSQGCSEHNFVIDNVWCRNFLINFSKSILR